MTEYSDLRAAMQEIAQIAGTACCETGLGDGDSIVCTPKLLPRRLQAKAAEVAQTINPVNAPSTWDSAGTRSSLVPAEIAVLTSKYWGASPRRLSVSFMESTPVDLRNRILSHMNAWQIGIRFAFTNGTGDVRISRGAGGYWSYLGTDIRLIPSNRPTMNLEGFTMSTLESEYRRVVRHETGHTLGFPHEHLRKELIARLDRQKTYDYFWEKYRWEHVKVDSNVLTPLDDRTIMGTPTDQTSIMCYQLPGRITKDGRPILGGTDINSTDSNFAKRIYPAASRTPSFDETNDSQETTMNEDDWGEENDVQSPVVD
ncbi:MAG: hypothetical protein U0941_24465 [Planctomycetaceae bacterium]